MRTRRVDSPRPVRLEVGVPDPPDVHREAHIPPFARGTPRAVSRASSMPVVGRWGNRQLRADRLDPIGVAVLLDEPHHHFARRSSSAWAKYADALRRISLARFSSRFSRSRSLSRARSSVLRPGRTPAFRSCCRTQRAASPACSQASRLQTGSSTTAIRARPGAPGPSARNALVPQVSTYSVGPWAPSSQRMGPPRIPGQRQRVREPRHGGVGVRARRAARVYSAGQTRGESVHRGLQWPPTRRVPQAVKNRGHNGVNTAQLQQAMFGDYLDGRAARRFAGTLPRLLVTGFLVLAASNNCRMPCSNSPTAFSKAPSCPTRTIAMDGFRSNVGGRNTFTVSIE